MTPPKRFEMLGVAILFGLFVIEAILVLAGALDGIDRVVLAALRDAADPGRARVSSGVVQQAILLTALGGGMVRIGVGLIVCAFLLVAKRGRDATLLASATITGILAMSLVKEVVGRARPDVAWRLVAADHASFPSGHAMGSMITWPLIGLAIGHAIGRTRLCVALGIALALAIGATRILLGVHWTSDVVGGWLLGGAWALGALAFASKYPPPPGGGGAEGVGGGGRR